MRSVNCVFCWPPRREEDSHSNRKATKAAVGNGNTTGDLHFERAHGFVPGAAVLAVIRAAGGKLEGVDGPGPERRDCFSNWEGGSRPRLRSRGRGCSAAPTAAAARRRASSPARALGPGMGGRWQHGPTGDLGPCWGIGGVLLLLVRVRCFSRTMGV